MRLRLLAIPLVVLAVIGLSGCFVFRTLNWGTLRLLAGQSTVATLAVSPGSTTPDTGRPFTLVGLDFRGDLSVGGHNKFDTKGNFGGPKPFIKDPALRDRLVNDSICSPQGLEDGNASYTALRTNDPVNDHGRVKKTALEKIRIKAVSEQNLSDKNPTNNVEFITGTWYDNGNGVPDSTSGGDQYNCTGGANSWMPIKGTPPSSKRLKRGDLPGGLDIPEGWRIPGVTDSGK